MIFAPPESLTKNHFLKWSCGNFYRQQFHFFTPPKAGAAREFFAPAFRNALSQKSSDLKIIFMRLKAAADMSRGAHAKLK